MRIIGGSHKGRVFRPGKFFKDRPTTDIAKESLFNILTNQFTFQDKDVLDLFSGTGSISFEFISRGAQQVLAVDSNYQYVKFIKNTAALLKMDSQITVLKSDVFSFLKHPAKPFDFIFADPPYDLKRIAEIPSIIFSNHLLKEGGLLIIEHPEQIIFPPELPLIDRRNYSRVNFSFFSGSL